MKRFITLIGLMLGLSITANAASWAYSPTGLGVTNGVMAKGGQISSVVLVASETNSLTVTLWDSPYITNYVNIGAYTNATITAITATALYTNVGGTTNTYTYSAVTNALATVNAAAKSFPTLGSWYVPTNQTLTLTFNGLYFNRGLLLTNNNAGVINVTYTTSR